METVAGPPCPVPKVMTWKTGGGTSRRQLVWMAELAAARGGGKEEMGGLDTKVNEGRVRAETFRTDMELVGLEHLGLYHRHQAPWR